MCFCILLTNLFNTGSWTAGRQMQRSATKIQFFCLSVTVPKKNRKTVGVCFTRQTCFCLSFSLVKLERSYIWLWFAVTWLLVIVMHFLSEWSCRALCGTLNSLLIYYLMLVLWLPESDCLHQDIFQFCNLTRRFMNLLEPEKGFSQSVFFSHGYSLISFWLIVLPNSFWIQRHRESIRRRGGKTYWCHSPSSSEKSWRAIKRSSLILFHY